MTTATTSTGQHTGTDPQDPAVLQAIAVMEDEGGPPAADKTERPAHSEPSDPGGKK